MKRREEIIKKIKETHSLKVLMMVTGMVLATLMAIGTATLARYIGEVRDAKLQAADAFHFTSNLLKEEGATYSVNGASASFVMINADDNLRFTEENISFSVEKSGTGTATLSATNGLLTGGSTDTETINITGASGPVTVTVTSTAPYEKELSATFVFTDPGASNTYEIIDYAGSYTAELRIYANSGIAANSLAVSWPSGVTPDSTSTFFGLVNPVSGATNVGAISSKSSFSILFFKTVISQNYATVKTAISGNSIDLPVMRAERFG